MLEPEVVDTPMTTRIGEVKIRDCGEIRKVGVFPEQSVRRGDYVMLEFDGELTYGVMCSDPCQMPFLPQMRVMKTVSRKATDEDKKQIQRLSKLSQEGARYCRQRCGVLGIPLKLVEVYCSLERRLMTCVYTAEERIDFRELVRDLARRFGGRIEMRQISTREEAKRLGGVDTCGLVLCCSSFLTDFRPVSVKHARALEMTMEESHLTGVCGRLKCCLMFETEASLPQGSRSPFPSLIMPHAASSPAVSSPQDGSRTAH